MVKKKQEPATDVSTRRFDVPVVAETEVVFRGVTAASPEEAEEKARRMYEEGAAAQAAAGPAVVEVGPAVEIERR